MSKNSIFLPPLLPYNPTSSAEAAEVYERVRLGNELCYEVEKLNTYGIKQALGLIAIRAKQNMVKTYPFIGNDKNAHGREYAAGDSTYFVLNRSGIMKLHALETPPTEVPSESFTIEVAAVVCENEKGQRDIIITSDHEVSYRDRPAADRNEGGLTGSFLPLPDEEIAQLTQDLRNINQPR